MSTLRTLRLHFPGGVTNEYRLRNTQLEFRQGHRNWRVMEESDVLMHFRFDTEVARWLRSYLVEKNPFVPIDSFQSAAREL